jgi:hypothetical protein
VLAGLLGGCGGSSPFPDLTETYAYRDTKPFGTYATKRIVENVFPGKEVRITKRAFSKTYAEVADTNALYFNVSQNLYLGEEDAQSMLDFVYLGNTLFISSTNIDSALLSKLFCKQQKFEVLMDLLKDYYRPTSVSIVPEIDPGKDSFNYYYRPFINYFSEIKANNTRVLGYNELGQPNCFILFWGKGKLILHCDPRAFSNYFLLSNANHMYLEQLLRLTDAAPQHIYWNDYYRAQNVKRAPNRDFSTFSEIMKHEPLAMGLWLFIALLLLYVLFNSKRRQRIIPVVKKNENSSITFTETIARLYLQQKDNKNIAEKMITYFNEYIRNNYFLNENMANPDFISALSRKSGVSLEQTSVLLKMIGEVNEKNQLNDQELLLLQEHIQNFYKNRN